MNSTQEFKLEVSIIPGPNAEDREKRRDIARPIVVVGAGGFGREVVGLIRAINDCATYPWRILGFIDDGFPDEAILGRLGVPHIGSMREIDRVAPGASFIVAISDPKTRSRLAIEAFERGLFPVTLIHPRATIGPDVEIGAGSVVCSGASLTTNVRVGDHCHIHVNTSIGHDTAMGDYVSVNPGAIVSGSVMLGGNTMVGAGSVVLQGLTVGSNAVIGAGAVVVGGVPRNQTVIGVPARERSKNH